MLKVNFPYEEVRKYAFLEGTTMDEIDEIGQYIHTKWDEYLNSLLDLNDFIDKWIICSGYVDIEDLPMFPSLSPTLTTLHGKEYIAINFFRTYSKKIQKMSINYNSMIGFYPIR